MSVEDGMTDDGKRFAAYCEAAGIKPTEERWRDWLARRATHVLKPEQLEPVPGEVRVVLLADGSLMAFRADAKYRVLRKIGESTLPLAFRAKELAEEYDFRAAALRLACEELA